MDLAGAVAGQHDHRRGRRDDGAKLRHRDLVVRQQFQQEGLERLVGTVQLVDQQHGGRLAGVDCAQQRAFLEKIAPEDAAAQARLIRLARRLGQAYGHQLLGVVPLVRCRGQVHAVVALQSHQPPSQPGRQHLRDLRLARPRLTLQEQRAPHD
jgi:hypothetical protein